MATIYYTAKKIVEKLIESYNMLSEIPLFVAIISCVVAGYFVFSYAYNTYAKFIIDGEAHVDRFPIVVLKSLLYLINAFIAMLTMVTLLGNYYMLSLLIFPLIILIYHLLPLIISEVEYKKHGIEGRQITKKEFTDFFNSIYKNYYFWFVIVVSGLTYILKILLVFVF